MGIGVVLRPRDVPRNARRRNPPGEGQETLDVRVQVVF